MKKLGRTEEDEMLLQLLCLAALLACGESHSSSASSVADRNLRSHSFSDWCYTLGFVWICVDMSHLLKLSV